MSQVSGTTTATQPGGAASPAVQPAVQPSQPSTTQTHTTQQIDPADYARVKQQLEGSRQFYEKAKTHGFGDAKDFDTWGPALKALSSRGIRPDMLAKAFDISSDNDPEGSAKDRIQDVEELINRRLTEVEAKWVKQQAEKEHDAACDSELGEFADDRISKLLGDDAPDALKKLAKDAAYGRYFTSRKPYGDDSPLKGGLMPLGKDGIAGIHKYLTDSVTAFRAAQLAKLGEAGKKPAPGSTVASSGTNQGKPNPTSNKRPGGLPPREAVEAQHAAMLARRQAARA